MKKIENDPDTKDKRVILDHHPHKGMAAHGTIRKATPFHMQQIVKPKKGGKF
jgi:hypothetical protein